MPKFCPDCGEPVEGKRFCPNCGANLMANQDQQNTISPLQSSEITPQSTEEVIMEFETQLLIDVGRAKLVGDLSIGQAKTIYTLTTERLIAKKLGMMSESREEIDLYQIKDVSIKQSITDKVRKVGDVTVISLDRSQPKLEMKNIKDPQIVADKIKDAARAKRKTMNITYRQEI